jgi:hypothetical protein
MRMVKVRILPPQPNFQENLNLRRKDGREVLAQIKTDPT